MSPRLRRRGTAALLTLLFAGLFVGLRSIPVSQCEFLHYDTDPNAASLSGEEELCSVAPVPFLNVAEQPFPVALEEESFERLPDGRMELLFRLQDPSGEDLLPHELALTHTKRVHFMLIDGQLGSYHHLHPEPLGNSGLYRVRFHPRSEDYRYFAEFVPKRTRQLAIADGFLDTGVRNPENWLVDLPIEMSLEGLDSRVRANRDHRIKLRLRHEDGKPLPLGKTMNAYAHLVAFEDTLSGYAHMHPLTVDPAITEEAEMEFLFHPTKPGHFRIWVQIFANGRDHFRSFDVEVL